MPKKSTQAEFIEKAIAAHGVGRYDYSRAEYTGYDSRLIIICPIHGQFEQRAINHTEGKGCPSCGKVSQVANSTKIDTLEFIKRAQNIHKDTYDYSQTEYTKYQSLVSIICKVHGHFSQIASTHLQGAGCWHCALANRTGKPNSKKQADFISRCKAVHPTYDFSKTIYTGSKNQINVICPVHGQFSARASTVLRGHECTYCAHEGGIGRSKSGWIKIQRGRKAVLYVAKLTSLSEVFYKVGITYDWSTRHAGIRPCYHISQVASYESDSPGDIWELEHAIHRALKHIKYKPKQLFGGCTECYSALQPILDLLPKS